MNPRICPNCKSEIPVDSNFFFDQNFNLICGNCLKIVFIVNKEEQKEHDARKHFN